MTIEQLAFALTQHADDLQMFANGVSMDAYGEFEQTEDRIMELIYQLYAKYAEKGLQPDAKTQKYIEDLKAKINAIRESAFEDAEDELEKEVREVVKNESKFLKAFFIALAGAAIGINAEWYDKISKYGIYNNGTLQQIFDKLKAGDVDRIFDRMLQAFRAGKDIEQTRNEVRKELQKTRDYVKSEIESVINGAAKDAALAFATENKTMLLYSTALDDKVCSECNDYHGRMFPYNSSEIPAVPQHFHCRCRLIPVPDNSAQYLKLDMPFAEYYAQLPESEQQKRIGTIKQQLAQSGDYTLKDYEQPMPEQRITIAELRERDKKALGKA